MAERLVTREDFRPPIWTHRESESSQKNGTICEKTTSYWHRTSCWKCKAWFVLNCQNVISERTRWWIVVEHTVVSKEIWMPTQKNGLYDRHSWQMSRKRNDAEPRILQKGSRPDNNSTSTLPIPPEETQPLGFRKFWWDLHLIRIYNSKSADKESNRVSSRRKFCGR